MRVRVRGAVVDLGGFLGGWVGEFVGFVLGEPRCGMVDGKKLEAVFMEMGRERKRVAWCERESGW